MLNASSRNVSGLSLTSLGCLQDDKAIVAIANPINKFLVFILLLFLVDIINMLFVSEKNHLFPSFIITGGTKPCNMVFFQSAAINLPLYHIVSHTAKIQ